MSNRNFDLIAQGILQQQQHMENIKAENRRLRQDLADLQSGRGIFVIIGDQRIALKSPADVQDSSPQPVIEHKTVQLEDQPGVEEAPAAIVEGAEHLVSVSSPQVDEKASVPTFLEEIMIDEFATASTSPMAIWDGPIKKQESIDEDQKAALRRELMGSYLLE